MCKNQKYVSSAAQSSEWIHPRINGGIRASLISGYVQYGNPSNCIKSFLLQSAHLCTSVHHNNYIYAIQ